MNVVDGRSPSLSLKRGGGKGRERKPPWKARVGEIVFSEAFQAGMERKLALQGEN